MWKGLRWRSSESDGEKRRSRYMRGLFHRFFHSRRRARTPWITFDRNNVSGLRYEKLKAHQDPEPTASADNEISTLRMASEVTYTEKVAMQMGKREKKKLLPLPAQLMRTLSIHHLECDNYVQSDGKASGMGNDRVIDSSQYVGSSNIDNNQMRINVLRDNKYNNDTYKSFEELSSLLFEKQELFQEKLGKAKLDLLKNQNADFTNPEENFSVNEVKRFLDALELFHTNREKFLKIIQDPNYLSTDYLRDLKISGVSTVLSRSVSCPGTGFSGGVSIASSNNKNDSSFVNPGGTSQSEISQETQTNLTIEDNLLNIIELNSGAAGFDSITHEMKNQGSFHHLGNMKRRIKDIRKDDSKGAYMIAMDGILNKIPAGPEFGAVESIVEEYRRKNKFGTQWDSSPDNSYLRRSHSLSNSIERYSRLLEPSSMEYHEHPSYKIQLIHEDRISHSVQDASTKPFRRFYSLPEYESYYPIKPAPNDNSDAILPISSPIITCIDLDMSCSFMTSPISDDQTPIEMPIILQMEDLITAKDTSSSVVVVDSSKDAVLGSIQCTDSNTAYGEVCSISNEHIGNNPLEDAGTGLGMDHADSAVIKPSPPLVAQPDADPLSTVRLSHLEEQGGHCDQKLSLTGDVHAGSGIISAPNPAEFDVDAFCVEVERTHATEFDYVMDLLKISGFGSSELHRKWHIPELPLDASLFAQLEGISPEIDIFSCMIDLNVDHLLLFDLTNEVLLEMYDPNSLLCSSSFILYIRRIPEGSLFLKEVWTNVNWHLSWVPTVNTKTDDIVSRDLAKNSGWMDARYGIEWTCQKLEKMIFDDVVDELVHELMNDSS